MQLELAGCAVFDFFVFFWHGRLSCCSPLAATRCRREWGGYKVTWWWHETLVGRRIWQGHAQPIAACQSAVASKLLRLTGSLSGSQRLGPPQSLLVADVSTFSDVLRLAPVDLEQRGAHAEPAVLVHAGTCYQLSVAAYQVGLFLGKTAVYINNKKNEGGKSKSNKRIERKMKNPGTECMM